ncbi:MAG TPA: DeoR/GlpR family DNA-binding transcription regulator [Anaerolineaceae bacterium]|jgi:DeoR family transcriptional regulator of aga operon|nr:DeoR/GlpR family DNA-binding transcription regulator [Anaerolineaceae bacterium]
MLSDERRAVLINRLREDGYVQAAEIAEELSVSTATIRRDLVFLQQEGFCMRTRGGAVRSSQGTTLELPYALKKQKFVAEKEAIAREAVRLIENGDTLILDSGSTTYALASLLTEKQRLTVVTNDLQIAILLASNPSVHLVCTGGIARPHVFTLQGSEVVNFIKTLRVDKTFLGTDAIHEDGTIGNVNMEEVAIKQAMMKAASTVILLADSSKFTVKGFAQVGTLAEVDILITDAKYPKEMATVIQENAIKLVVAK